MSACHRTLSIAANVRTLNVFFFWQTVDGQLDGQCRSSANLPLGGGRRLRGYLARMEREGVRRVRMFVVITTAYILFWGPLFLVTLFHHPSLTSHIAYEVISIIYLVQETF